MSTRIFKIRTFDRWARKAKLGDAALVDAVTEMQAGLVEADLGGHVMKQRVALPGRGKRGSVRTIVATRFADRWYFLFGFNKNERENIRNDELRALQALAGDLLAMDDRSIASALIAGTIVEIDDAPTNAAKPPARGSP